MTTTPPPDSLFTYGTLMCQDIFHLVAGHIPASAPARLDGYSRRALKERVYPALIPCNGMATEGILYTGIDAGTFLKLDTYEGEMYSRPRIFVSCKGIVVSAFTYVLKPELHYLAEQYDWNFNHFLSYHAGSYCAQLALVNTSELC